YRNVTGVQTYALPISLAADTIRAMIKTVNVWLNTAIIFPIKKMTKDQNVNFVRSVFAKTTSKIGAEIANTIENMDINNPALPIEMFKSTATKSNMPPIISSTIPTINAMVVSIYTRLSIKIISSYKNTYR